MDKFRKKNINRSKRVKRIRKKIHGTLERPRLCIHRSLKHIYAQIIDDEKCQTLLSASSIDKNFSTDDLICKIDIAKKIGNIIAINALSIGIKNVIFDRGCNKYHGRIKSLADGARDEGLLF